MGGGWLYKEAFGTLQTITWLDVSCWQQFLNLVAEGPNKATERKKVGVIFYLRMEPSKRDM